MELMDQFPVAVATLVVVLAGYFFFLWPKRHHVVSTSATTPKIRIELAGRQNTWSYLCNTDELAPKGLTRIQIDDRMYTIMKSKQGWRLVHDSCPHMGAPLYQGNLTNEGESLRCSFHGLCLHLGDEVTDVEDLVNTKLTRMPNLTIHEAAGSLWMWSGTGTPWDLELDDLAATPGSTIDAHYDGCVPQVLENHVDKIHFREHGSHHSLHAGDQNVTIWYGKPHERFVIYDSFILASHAWGVTAQKLPAFAVRWFEALPLDTKVTTRGLAYDRVELRWNGTVLFTYVWTARHWEGRNWAQGRVWSKFPRFFQHLFIQKTLEILAEDIVIWVEQDKDMSKDNLMPSEKETVGVTRKWIGSFYEGGHPGRMPYKNKKTKEATCTVKQSKGACAMGMNGVSK